LYFYAIIPNRASRKVATLIVDTQAAPKLLFTPGTALRAYVLEAANTPDRLDMRWLNDMALLVDKLTVTTRTLHVRIANRNGCGWVELPEAIFGLTGGVVADVALHVQRDAIMHGTEVIWQAPPPPRVPSN
jgi:hypothetical protein